MTARRGLVVALVAAALLVGIAWLLRPDTGARHAAEMREELAGGRPRRAPREAPRELPRDEPPAEAIRDSDGGDEPGDAASSGKVLDEAQLRRGKEEAWLPEPLYGLLGEMDRLQPTPERLERLEELRGQALTDDQRDALLQAYKDRFEDAAIAAGRWRLGEIPVEDAAAAMNGAHDGYRVDARAIAGVDDDTYERVFGYAE